MRNTTKTKFIAMSAALLCGMSTTACANTNSSAESRETAIEAQNSVSNNDNFFSVSSITTAPEDFTYAAENTINGVVSIKSYATQRAQRYNGFESFADPFFEFFFGNPGNRRRQQPRQQEEEQSQQQLGLGSGVIVNSDGYIVTNNHVIEGADKLEVTLNDNRTFEAEVIGTDATTDLALLKIETKNLPTIPIGSSDSLKVGEWVLAVGNPFGFTSTVTTGIVSAKARSISSVTHGRQLGIESFIQTDAAVNPGNSGGALVNTKGELVGINTAIYSQTGNYAGYSFAIPTSIMTKVINDIREYGAVQRAVLGIAYSELTPKIIKEKNITAVNAGLYVGRVEELSSAMEAGIKEGDIIIAINGKETVNSGQLQEQMSKYRPGDKITVTYFRDNKKETATATLRNNQGDMAVTKANKISDLGCEFDTPSEELSDKLGIRKGIGAQVTKLTDGKFKESGIENGFIILTINKTRITSPKDVEDIYYAIIKSDDTEKAMIISGIYPNGKKAYYAVLLMN